MLWNPGTRYIISRVLLDRDAITHTPPKARRLLRAGGFEVLRTDFLFVFPKCLGWRRKLEPALAGLRLGGQIWFSDAKPEISGGFGLAPRGRLG